jgi:trimethylamine--corrinoid protein Co-methyltransferase
MAKAVLRPLTKEQEEAVHLESLRILREVGIKVTSKQVFSMLAENGAEADARTQVVKIPEEMVREALGHAPKEFVMCARDKSHDLPMPAPGRPYGVNDGQPTYVWDMETQRKRKSTIKDLIEFTLLCDAMPEVDLYWPEVAATDLPPGPSNNHEFVAGIFHTGKHVQHGGDDVDVRFQIAAAAKIVGSYEELAKRPIISITHTPITPLRFEAGDVDAVVEMARAGLPVVHLSMAISGSVAPVTLVGTVALVNAENLAGTVISQLAKPGAPILYSSESGPMDMRTGVFLSGSTEGSLINAAGCQMALRYKLPSQVGGIAASGCVPGFEVGYQKAISALIPALAGADQVVGIGGFERSGCESLEQVVMDCELWRNVLRAWSGIEVNESTLAFEAISRVGPGGYFMKDPHTLRHFRQETLQPKIALLNQVPGSDEEPMRAAARAEAKRVLEEHRPLELDRSVRQEILDLLDRFDREAFDESVPMDNL